MFIDIVDANVNVDGVDDFVFEFFFPFEFELLLLAQGTDKNY